MRKQGNDPNCLNPDVAAVVALMTAPNTPGRPQVYSVEVLDSEGGGTLTMQGRERA